MTQYIQTSIRAPEYKLVKELKPGQMFISNGVVFALCRQSLDEDNHNAAVRPLFTYGKNPATAYSDNQNWQSFREDMRVQIVHGIF